MRHTPEFTPPSYRVGEIALDHSVLFPLRQGSIFYIRAMTLVVKVDLLPDNTRVCLALAGELDTIPRRVKGPRAVKRRAAPVDLREIEITGAISRAGVNLGPLVDILTSAPEHVPLGYHATRDVLGVTCEQHPELVDVVARFYPGIRTMFPRMPRPRWVSFSLPPKDGHSYQTNELVYITSGEADGERPRLQTSVASRVGDLAHTLEELEIICDIFREHVAERAAEALDIKREE